MAGLFEDETPAAFSGPSLFGEEPAAAPAAAAYRVLARKYRPTTFHDLIGQEALVRTLRNAFAMNRIAHAFMLTGVRGVGKTTTARILARALNCTGPDGTGGPTPDPCGVCDNWRRHPGGPASGRCGDGCRVQHRGGGCAGDYRGDALPAIIGADENIHY